jgi:hypothetical protein
MSPEKEKQMLIEILKQTAAYTHQVIKTSGALESTPWGDVQFIDMAIGDMRGEVMQSIAKLGGDYKNLRPEDLESEIGFSIPIILEIKKRKILEKQIGNCGEFVVLALTHLLENHKKDLGKTFIFVVASYVNNNPNHVYLHIAKKLSDNSIVKLLFDPTTKEVCDNAVKTGNIFVRAQPNRGIFANQYKALTPNEFNSQEELTIINPATIAYPPKPQEGIIL